MRTTEEWRQLLDKTAAHKTITVSRAMLEELVAKIERVEHWALNDAECGDRLRRVLWPRRGM